MACLIFPRKWAAGEQRRAVGFKVIGCDAIDGSEDVVIANRPAGYRLIEDLVRIGYWFPP